MSSLNLLKNRRDVVKTIWGAAMAGAAGFPIMGHSATSLTNPLFGLGVASGEPHPQGFTLWTRLHSPQTVAPFSAIVPVSWEVAKDEQFKSVVQSGVALAEATWGHSVHVDLNGLESSRTYWYRFTAEGQRSAVGKTRTTPAANSSEPLKFVIASCQRWDQGHFAAWHHVAQEAPDLILFLGDYIYEYGPIQGRVRMHEGGRVVSLQNYRDRYAQYKSDPALQAAHAVAPWMCTWDDHEVDDDYAGTVGADLQPEFQNQRNAAYQAYWENMPFPMSKRPNIHAANVSFDLYRRTPWGNLAQIHFLDDRQYRDQQVCPRPNKAGSNVVKVVDCPAVNVPARTLLGFEQEQWLYKGWDTHRPWNLLAQQTLMAQMRWSDPAAADGGSLWTDGWDGYPASRARLLKSIQDKQVKGVVCLGGDVHAHFVTDLKANFDDVRSAVVATEFCGSSISSFGMDNNALQKSAAFNPHIKYARSDQRGYISFTLTHKSLEARIMALKNVNDPQSAIDVARVFTVDPKQPGAVEKS